MSDYPDQGIGREYIKTMHSHYAQQNLLKSNRQTEAMSNSHSKKQSKYVQQSYGVYYPERPSQSIGMTNRIYP